MGQVPMFSQYLIIGGGRVARHFAHYFALESLPFQTWTRRTDPENLAKSLREKTHSCSHILLLISDRSVGEFYRQHDFLSEKICLHFSGSLYDPAIAGAHPLMTFSDQLYDLDTYRRIPFILEEGRGAFSELLPGLTNSAHMIAPEKKALYHALCVLGGNFSTMLWEKVFADFENKLGLPKDVALPYLERVTQNLISSPSGKTVLTGPLVRGDSATLARHLYELQDDPFADVYRAFVEAYRSTHAL